MLKFNYITLLFTFFCTLCANAAHYPKTIHFVTQQVNKEFRLNPKDVPFVENNITHGLALLKTIISGNYLHSEPETTMKDSVAVIWALFHLAIAKDQGFDEGSFVIEDQHQHIFNFFKLNPMTYQRRSSHLEYVKYTSGQPHYGIDLFGTFSNEGADWSPCINKLQLNSHDNCSKAPILPTQKSHILFGNIPKGDDTATTKDLIFLKIEPNGLMTWSGYAHHAADFLHSRLDKYIKSADFFQGRKFRVERVDSQLKQAWLKVLTFNSEFFIDYNLYNYLGSQLGLRFMIKSIEAALSESRSINPSIAEFQTLYYSRDYDHLEMRTGNEVIFSIQELERSLRQTP